MSRVANRHPACTDCIAPISSGEFHTFRLPVPELWLDIFQKMVAAGLNGVRYVSYVWFRFGMRAKSSLDPAYTSTVRTPPTQTYMQLSTDVLSVGLTNPSRRVIDFDNWRALKPVYEAASEAGIFVVLRPGKQFISRPVSVTDGVRDRSLRKYTKNAAHRSSE